VLTSQLSGGEQQIQAIGRALMLNLRLDMGNECYCFPRNSRQLFCEFYFYGA